MTRNQTRITTIGRFAHASGSLRAMLAAVGAKRIACAGWEKYQAILPPKCGCLKCLVKWQNRKNGSTASSEMLT